MQQRNFFISKGETFVRSLGFTQDGVSENLTGNTFKLDTPDQSVAGVISGNLVTFSLSPSYTTKYVISRTQSDGTFSSILYGYINVLDWLAK